MADPRRSSRPKKTDQSTGVFEYPADGTLASYL